jgi:ABC-type oligopeptide transport system substrate-binding subunit
VAIRLRKGVAWQDGQPFTSADVKYTLEALRDAPPEINGASDYKEYVKSVDAPDSLTAVIHFTKPAPRWEGKQNCGTTSDESFLGIVTLKTPLSSFTSIASASKLRSGK